MDKLRRRNFFYIVYELWNCENLYQGGVSTEQTGKRQMYSFIKKNIKSIDMVSSFLNFSVFTDFLTSSSSNNLSGTFAIYKYFFSIVTISYRRRCIYLLVNFLNCVITVSLMLERTHREFFFIFQGPWHIWGTQATQYLPKKYVKMVLQFKSLL